MPSANVLAHPMPGALTDVREGARSRWFGFLVLAHVPLGLLVASSEVAATAHAAIVLLIGLTFACDPARPDRVASVAGYIVGCEVLWRMTNADVFHQFGKYAIAAILFVAFLRGGRHRHVLAPIAYFALLLPSTALVRNVSGYDPGFIGSISFNLSGPLALAMSVAFFRQIELTRSEMAGVLASISVGTIAVLVVAMQSTLGADRIAFTGESNFVTSGGYGPNQVAAMLGLGALCLVLARAIAPRRTFAPVAVSLLVLALIAQCLLTLSRGGIYAAAGAFCLGLPFLVGPKAERGRVLARVVAVVALIALLITPLLDEFTGGALERRFSDQRLAGRGLLMLRDLSVWEHNPLFGAGPGMSRLSRVEGFNVTLVHTEFTRLVAEHGLLGVLSLWLMLAMAFQHVRRAPKGRPRFVSATLCAWSFLFMAAVAFRLSAPAFCLGLAAAYVPAAAKDTEPEPDE